MFGRRAKKINTDSARIAEALTRGVAEVVDRDHLVKRLGSGERLRIKLGVDPTSPHIHLGRAVQLLKLRDFQELGHKVIFIIGDATGVVGDTSDKESERPMLSRAAVEENCKTYLDQVKRVLDMDAVEVRRNSEWLHKLSYEKIGEHADQFSLSDFIARENIKRRLDAGKRVSLRETLYPLMQGYDSVAVEADVEIGGTDQRFNLLAGRVLQEHAGQSPQDFLTTELIAGTDGRKMSSSWGNTINITDAPTDMFGKVMRAGDDMIIQYFTACTRVPMDEVAELERGLSAGGSPRDAKLRLAQEIVALYYGSDAAASERDRFVEVISKGGVPSDVAEVRVLSGASWIDMLVESGITTSRSEARRMPVYIHRAGAWKAVEDVAAPISPEHDEGVIKIGKKEFRTLRLS